MRAVVVSAARPELTETEVPDPIAAPGEITSLTSRAPKRPDTAQPTIRGQPPPE